MSTSYAFSNKVSDVEPGTLDVGDVGGRQMTDRVYLEFDRLLVKGATQPADAQITIGAFALGNCAGTFQSSITALSDDGWTVQISNLHKMPYCGGAAVAGSFAACLIPEPF